MTRVEIAKAIENLPQEIMIKNENKRAFKNLVLEYDSFTFGKKIGLHFHTDAIGYLALTNQFGFKAELDAKDNIKFLNTENDDTEESPLSQAARILKISHDRASDIFVCLAKKPSIPVTPKQIATAIRALR